MKKIFLLLALASMLMISNSLQAQNNSTKIIPGTWMGKLAADGMELRVVFNLKYIEKDSLIATLDSPDQGATGLPAGKVTLKANDLKIEAPDINGEYVGTIKGDSTIDGTWSQNGGTFDLNLKKQKGPVVK